MILHAVLAVFLYGALTAAGAEDMPANQEAKTFSHRLSQEVALRCLLFLPEGYKENPGQRWPLMLFLHGAGERGTNLARVAVHGPPKVVKTRRDFPFILVSPQCPAGQLWQDDALLALLDEIQREYRVDENRVYLTGLSMGGYGTWSLGLRHPGRFAAIAPICGGGSIIHTLLPEPGKQAALKRLPVWAFHGAKDPVVPLSQSEEMVNVLKRAGNASVRLTVYPETGHDAWTEPYGGQELYEWLLQHTREKKTSQRRAKPAAGNG